MTQMKNISDYADASAMSNRRVVKAVLLIVSMLTVAATATLAPAAPAIQNAFTDVENVGLWVRLVVTLPALFILIGAPFAGAIVDRYGRKPLLIVSVALYALGGTSGYLALSLPYILLGRAVLGLAVAGIMTSVTTLIADYYTGDIRAQLLGLQSAFMGLGGTTFVTLGGILADIDWRTPFLIYLLALGILPFIVTVLFEPTRKVETNTLNPVTATFSSQHLRLMAVIYGTIFLIQVVYFTVAVQLPFHLPIITGGTATQSGLAVAWLSLSYALASALAKRLKSQVSYAFMLIAGFSLIGLGMGLIGLAQGWMLLLLGLPLTGAGIGLIQPTMNVLLTSKISPAQRGRAIGIFTMAIFLGQFTSPFISQPVVNALDSTGMFMLFGLIALFIAGVVIALRKLVQQIA